MISPGCSFEFDGLKQTLRSIKDVKLRKVEQLVRNYRMTKSVLELGNSIVEILRRFFPGQIAPGKKEVPMKDFGIKVCLVKWNEAQHIEEASLGTEQAIVYSAGSEDSEEKLRDQMISWTDRHPFILPVLDAKGLEYDVRSADVVFGAEIALTTSLPTAVQDVIVAFDKSRNAWDVNKKTIELLRNLRELYVAVTRARKRVVVLIKGQMMDEFFERLGCSSELQRTSASVALLDFNKETSPEIWFKQGVTNYENGRFDLAESCFIRAEQTGWSNRAQGKHLVTVKGENKEAKVAFRTSSRAFYEGNDFGNCLDVLKDMAELEGIPWDVQDNEILDSALEQHPNHLSREWTVKFAIVRGAFHIISAEDLTDRRMQSVFLGHRHEQWLIEKIGHLDVNELATVAGTLPSLVGDYCFGQRRFVEAVELFFKAHDEESAVQATESAVDEAKKGRGDMARVVRLWNEFGSYTGKNENVLDLLALFNTPQEIAKSKPALALERFGRHTVRQAVQQTSISNDLLLYSFHRNFFHDEVENALLQQHKNTPFEIVRFYTDHNDRVNALAFAELRLESWSHDELLSGIFGEMLLRSVGVVGEIRRRGLLLDAVRICLRNGTREEVDTATTLSNMALDNSTISVEVAEAFVQAWKQYPDCVGAINGAQRNISTIALLLQLFDQPRATGRKSGGQCMQKFGEAIVRKAVRDNVESDDREIYKVLTLFDKQAFEADKPIPKPHATSTFAVGDFVRTNGLINKQYDGVSSAL
jgi:hypothetical protein